MAEGTADNIGAVELAIQAALDAASWSAAQAAAQDQGRIIGTQLAKAIQATVAQTPIQIRPQLQGGPDLDGFRRRASPQITPPPLPPPIPPGYLQQLAAAQGASAGLGSAIGGAAGQAGGLRGALTTLLGSLGPVAGGFVAAGGAIAGAAAALAGIGGAALLVVQPFIRVAGEAQRLKAAFDSLAGSEAGGLAIRETLSRLSESTPFPDLQIQQLGRQFLAVGVEAEALEGTINRIGALAAQSGQDVGRIGLIYAQVFAKGRLQYEENLQLLEAGIDLTEELSQVTGLTGNALRDAMSKGRVGVAEFNAALTLATGNMDALTKAALSVDVAQSNLGDNIGRVFRQLSVSVAPAISGVFGVLNKAFDDFLGENKLQTLATLFEPIRAEAERLAQTLANSPQLVQSISGLLETGIRISVDAIAGALDFINDQLESGAVEAFAQRIADTELSFRRVAALLGPIIEDVAKFVKFTNNIQPLALALSRGASLEEARQAFGQLLAPDAWDGFSKGVQDAASQRPITIDPVQQTIREPRGNLDDRGGAGGDANPATAQRREQLIGIQQEQQKIIAAISQEAQQAAAINRIYNDRTQSFNAQQAAAERLVASGREMAGYAKAELEYSNALAALSRTRADADAQAAANLKAAQDALDARIEKARRALNDATTADAGVKALQNLQQITGSGQEAVQQAGQLTNQSRQQIQAAQTGVLKAGAELQKVSGVIGSNLARNIAEAVNGLRTGDLFSIDAAPLDAASREFGATLEVSTANLAEVYGFASQVFAQFGETGTTVYEQLRQVFGGDGVALAERFNSAFAGAREAAQNLAQAADRLQGSRVTLEREGLISRGAQAEGIQNALRQITEARTNNPDLNPQAVEVAIRKALASGTPLAGLSSLADTLRNSQQANVNNADAAAAYRDATQQAVTAQNNLADAINRLLPQIQINVNAPVGVDVNSNMPLRY